MTMTNYGKFLILLMHGGIGRLLFRVFDVVINLKEGTMADSKYTLAIICHTQAPKTSLLCREVRYI